MLLLSIVLLWLAPWVHGLVRRDPRVQKWTHNALIVLVVLLVLGVILPESIRAVGWVAVLLVAAGTLLPSLLERVWHRSAEAVHWFPVLIGLVGLALHASLDGAAFVDPDHAGHTHMHALPVAVVVHRFFEGLFVWLFLRPKFGVKLAAGALAMISAFSLLGYWAGDHYFHQLEGATAFGYFQALVAGSLLHLVMDPHDHDGAHGHDRHDHHDHDHHGHAH